MRCFPTFAFGCVLLLVVNSALAVIKGDLTGDRLRDGEDIHPFVAVLFGQDLDPLHWAAADFNCDNAVDSSDLAAFINVLVNTTGHAPVEGGSAVIIGKVLDTNGQPLQGAFAYAVYYPGYPGAPPLPPVATTGADGMFTYNTV